MPTATPVAQNTDEARNLVWVFLGRCTSLDPSQLDAYQVQRDWFVKASSDSPQEFGLWKVDAKTGTIAPQDPLARELDSFVQSQCSQDLLPASLVPTPTPRPTATPRPTPTPTPTPIPLVTKPEDAVAALWAYLVECFPNLAITDLQAQFDPSKGEWVVIEQIVEDPLDYPVWRVRQPDGRVPPENVAARTRAVRVTRGC